ncbi:hypothetical protein K503DRAFT_87795 [Rhizopogon vinicolor AM-OR11-026]|uniref:Uncharacterized protein n=1 Tax=Rhizopogon vinicolor AM-OR11-026 TaxID=1314800 RepID=A0A1B7NFJ8_9AGAM|nr:hypothetical protein K503DRAFT_87795 [Rhizopogon vinicolor AM-OR11-026]
MHLAMLISSPNWFEETIWQVRLSNQHEITKRRNDNLRSEEVTVVFFFFVFDFIISWACRRRVRTSAQLIVRSKSVEYTNWWISLEESYSINMLYITTSRLQVKEKKRDFG